MREKSKYSVAYGILKTMTASGQMRSPAGATSKCNFEKTYRLVNSMASKIFFHWEYGKNGKRMIIQARQLAAVKTSEIFRLGVTPGVFDYGKGIFILDLMGASVA